MLFARSTHVRVKGHAYVVLAAKPELNTPPGRPRIRVRRIIILSEWHRLLPPTVIPVRRESDFTHFIQLLLLMSGLYSTFVEDAGNSRRNADTRHACGRALSPLHLRPQE